MRKLLIDKDVENGPHMRDPVSFMIVSLLSFMQHCV